MTVDNARILAFIILGIKEKRLDMERFHYGVDCSEISTNTKKRT